MQKYLVKRNIFIVLGMVILAEVLWAGWSLVKPTPPSTVAVPVTSQTSISLSADKSQLRVRERILVTINVASAKKVDGVDLIITYDPKLLTAQPTVLGTIFSDYPQNKVDATLGRVSVSGITTQQGGVIPEGQFAAVTFVAKAVGLTKVSLDFTPGKTGDTNVTETGTGADILEKVNQLEINILP